MAEVESVQVGEGNVIIRGRKLYRTRGDTTLIYIPEPALKKLYFDRRRRQEVKTTIIITLDTLNTLTYNYITTLIPQSRKGEYAYNYYYLQIPAKIVHTIETDLEDLGLDIEDFTAEVQLIEGEKGLEAIILLKPQVESD